LVHPENIALIAHGIHELVPHLFSGENSVEYIARQLAHTNVHSLNYRYRPDQVEFLLGEYKTEDVFTEAVVEAVKSKVNTSFAVYIKTPKNEVKLFRAIQDYDYQSCEDYNTYRYSKVKSWLNATVSKLAESFANRYEQSGISELDEEKGV